MEKQEIIGQLSEANKEQLKSKQLMDLNYDALTELEKEHVDQLVSELLSNPQAIDQFGSELIDQPYKNLKSELQESLNSLEKGNANFITEAYEIVNRKKLAKDGNLFKKILDGIKSAKEHSDIMEQSSLSVIENLKKQYDAEAQKMGQIANSTSERAIQFKQISNEGRFYVIALDQAQAELSNQQSDDIYKNLENKQNQTKMHLRRENLANARLSSEIHACESLLLGQDAQELKMILENNSGIIFSELVGQAYITTNTARIKAGYEMNAKLIEHTENLIKDSNAKVMQLTKELAASHNKPTIDSKVYDEVAENTVKGLKEIQEIIHQNVGSNQLGNHMDGFLDNAIDILSDSKSTQKQSAAPTKKLLPRK